MWRIFISLRFLRAPPLSDITMDNLKLFVFLGVISLSYGYHRTKWGLFKEEHGKQYNLNEDEMRMKVYFDNMLSIKKHNIRYEKGKESFKLNMNHLGDLMTTEVNSIMNGLKYTNKTRTGTMLLTSVQSEVPALMDWREKGAVTSVKNQGKCGSCWAFSATGALEGQISLKKNKSVSLSEQNLIDCSKNYNNHGCHGGFMENAFMYIKDNRGIDTEDTYPYETAEGECRFLPQNVGGTDNGYVMIPEGNENDLKIAVGTTGPVSVAIDASSPMFHFYSTGIYDNPQCKSDSNSLDHGVLVVGYGRENEQDYWLVKNSWGPKWGDNGYIKMARNKNNQCGIATLASYPVL